MFHRRSDIGMFRHNLPNNPDFQDYIISKYKNGEWPEKHYIDRLAMESKLIDLENT